MKKIAAMAAACVAAVCLFAGCEPKKKTISSLEVTQQKSESYEDAVRECFDSAYSSGGGEVFYQYMYPNAVLDTMKEKGVYDSLIETFNLGIETRKGMSDDVFTFSSIAEAHEINETQTAAAKTYLISLSKEYLPTLTEEQLDIKEGYEVTFNYLKNGEADGQDVVLAISLGDEGWKIITG